MNAKIELYLYTKNKKFKRKISCATVEKAFNYIENAKNYFKNGGYLLWDDSDHGCYTVQIDNLNDLELVKYRYEEQ